MEKLMEGSDKLNFTHVIVFDSKADNHVRIDNLPDNIEYILENSPIIAKINNKYQVIGVITNVQNRPNTFLYYGNIYILNKYYQFKKIRIYKHSIEYKSPPIKGIYHATNIITYVERINKNEI
jgi:hypothetical protein